MARQHLGLSSDEFFRLTPRQFHLLLDRHDERAEYEEYLAALIASTTANFSLVRAKKPLRPADFMQSRERERPQVRRQQLPRDVVAQNIRCFLLARVEAQKQAMANAS